MWTGQAPAADPAGFFCDREVSAVGVNEGVCTIKADAANDLFDISCRNMTWAIIDPGIDAKHPAFKNHERPSAAVRARVKAMLDFTHDRADTQFDRHRPEAGSDEKREEAITQVINSCATERAIWTTFRPRLFEER